MNLLRNALWTPVALGCALIALILGAREDAKECWHVAWDWGQD